MEADAIVSISAAIVAVTQIAKWYGVPDSKGPLVVIGLSALGVLLFIISQPLLPGRSQIFQIFVAWIAVTLNAAGIYGFTRAAVTSVTQTKPTAPPTGAGVEATVKS